MKTKDIVIRAAKIFASLMFAVVFTCSLIGFFFGILTFDVFLIIGMTVHLFLCICVYVWMLDRGIIDDWLGEK